MKKTDKDLDRIFKEGLGNPEDQLAFHDEDWQAMEAMLDEKENRRGFVFRLPVIISAVAAMLLLALGLFIFLPGKKDGQQITKNPVKVKTTTQNPLAGDTAAAHEQMAQAPHAGSQTSVSGENTSTQQQTQRGPSATRSIAPSNGENFTSLKRPSKNGRNIANATGSQGNDLDDLALNATKNGGSDFGQKQQPAIQLPQQGLQPIISGSNPLIAAVGTDNGNKAGNAVAGAGQSTLASVDTNAVRRQVDSSSRMAAAKPVKEKKKPAVKGLGTPHPLVLSIIAAPDINGVNNSFSRGQMGSNAGLMLSLGVTRKFTVSAGAVYARKPYSINFSQYHTLYNFKVQPAEVDADCRVLDIPINVDYNVYNKGGNSFSVGTGISSYIMLRENYHYDYYNGITAGGPTDYDIANRNRHLFGVVNLNATYQRRISAKFGLNIQPYMKLPLTDIGYGRVNLQSTGVAIGASWYLNASAKPK